MLHYLIGCGESGNLDNPKTNYTQAQLLLHMDMINAVMVKMKPGFFSIFGKITTITCKTQVTLLFLGTSLISVFSSYFITYL